MLASFGQSINFLVLVFGLVEFFKKFGLKGRTLTGASMIIGIVLGVAYQVAQRNEAFGEYFQIALFGLAVGLAASGVYDFLDKRFPPVEG